jgi:FAD-dependent oxidoreductase domain-containing protein 1
MSVLLSADDRYDVVIVGGGVMGCSTAYHLLQADADLRVLVVERDPTYRLASSALSAGNARIQFSLAENVEISRYTMEVLSRFAEEMESDGIRPDIAFKPEGNLFLIGDEEQGEARAAMELQRRLGCRVEWWTPDEVEQRFPLYRVSDMAGGTFGPDDGHLDGYAFLMGYRRRAISLGAEMVDGEAIRLKVASGAVTGVETVDGRSLRSAVVVNCAGAWAADLMRSVGVELPVLPVQRQVFLVEPAEKPEAPLPLTNLPSGLYFRSESDDRILVGRSFPDDPVGYRFDWQESRFNDLLWPELVEVVPVFDRLRFAGGWAGLYAVNTFDGNALLGEWPEIDGLFLANGFSGHGLQQAPAVGRYLAESILLRDPVLDLSRLHPGRLLAGERLSESVAV